MWKFTCSQPCVRKDGRLTSGDQESPISSSELKWLTWKKWRTRIQRGPCFPKISCLNDEKNMINKTNEGRWLCPYTIWNLSFTDKIIINLHHTRVTSNSCQNFQTSLDWIHINRGNIERNVSIWRKWFNQSINIVLHKRKIAWYTCINTGIRMQYINVRI